MGIASLGVNVLHGISARHPYAVQHTHICRAAHVLHGIYAARHIFYRNVLHGIYSRHIHFCQCIYHFLSMHIDFCRSTPARHMSFLHGIRGHFCTILVRVTSLMPCSTILCRAAHPHMPWQNVLHGICGAVQPNICRAAHVLHGIC